MSTGKKLALFSTVVLLVAVGLRVYFLRREHNDPGIVKNAPQNAYKVTDDDLVHVRKLFAQDLKDVQALSGKKVWVQAGGQLPYFPFAASHVDYAKPAGILPELEPLLVQTAVQQAAPPNVRSPIPAGERQVLVVFRKADTGSSDTGQYAVPVGYQESGSYSFSLDDIFYFDDPHSMYNKWPAEAWTAIDAHQVKPGMSELQTNFAVGPATSTSSNEIGNRTVDYSGFGKPVRVTFQQGKAAEIKPE